MPSRPRPGTSDEIRRAFIEFFAERGHVHQPSSSLVPFNDPSVLLTTAGMQQMIPYMLGREAPPAVRMTSVQKCFRTGDIDEVGNPRNLTFFEMLGNFSIGDYFKETIIPWAWEFVTEWLQFAARARLRHRPPVRRRGAPDLAQDRAPGRSGSPRSKTTGGARQAPKARAAQTPSSTTTGARSSAAASRTARPAATVTATWSSGTSCSCSSTRTAQGNRTPLAEGQRRHRLRAGARHRHHAERQDASTRRTCSCPIIDAVAEHGRHRRSGGTSAPTTRCGWWPIMRAA